MKVLKFSVIALLTGMVTSGAANGQQSNTADQAATVPPGWTLPAELASKRLSDDAIKSSNGNFETLLKNTPGDEGRIPGVTQSYILTSPSGLPQVINYAVQSTTNEEASEVGLGLCTTTASLMSAANNPASPPAQGQAARNLARSILSSVAAASATSSRTNQAISTSFGVAVNANGGVAVTCKALNGEVVATTAVTAAAAGSSAGLGAPVNSSADPSATVGLNSDQSSSGGAGRHVSFAGGTSALTFTRNAARSSVLAANAGGGGIITIGGGPSSIVITGPLPVPGPDVGAGLMPFVAGLGGYWFLIRRRRTAASCA